MVSGSKAEGSAPCCWIFVSIPLRAGSQVDPHREAGRWRWGKPLTYSYGNLLPCSLTFTSPLHLPLFLFLSLSLSGSCYVLFLRPVSPCSPDLSGICRVGQASLQLTELRLPSTPQSVVIKGVRLQLFLNNYVIQGVAQKIVFDQL